MEKAYRVNIDFELQVSLGTTKSLRPAWQREWEYLFWWIAPHTELLGSHSPDSYQKQYLDYIGTKTNRDSFFSKSKQYENWWGNPLDPRVVQKTDLPQIRQDVFHECSSYKGKPLTFPCVVKTNGDFGGRGVYFLRSEKDYAKHSARLDKQAIITEPFRKISLDFSYYKFKDETVFYRSDINSQGGYRGSLFSSDISWLDQSELVRQQANKLSDYLQRDSYGVDCYFYNQDSQQLLEPLCEINSRRTIASCVFEIFQKYFSHYKYARNLIIPMKNINKLECFKDERVIELSPKQGQHFYHLLILENTEDELVKLANQLQQFFYCS